MNLDLHFLNYYRLAKGPSVSREKKMLKKFHNSYNSPRSPLSVHKKFQPKRSSHLAYTLVSYRAWDRPAILNIYI